MVIKIRDIVSKGMNFLRFRIHDCSNGKFAITIEKKEFQSTYSKNLRIGNITPKRMEQLANDILSYIGKKAKKAEWKPTLNELKDQVEKIHGGFGMENWFIDWVRACACFPTIHKDEINQIVKIYKWLKGNEKWLYEKHEEGKSNDT